MHKVRIVENSQSGNPKFTSQVVCSCGWRDPVSKNSYLTKQDAEWSAGWHGRCTGHPLERKVIDALS